jgi:putative phosphoesterase
VSLVILGLISDIHGNSTALDAVIDDAREVGVERWWVLGDIVALGPDPIGVLRTLEGLPNVEMIGGNTERYVINGDRPFPRLDDVRRDPDLLERLIEVEASLSWTRGVITAAGYFDSLAGLRSELRHTLPDGTRMLGVHASPHSDDGPGIDTIIGDSELGDLLGGCGADLVFAGHTHDATDRVVNGVRAVNPGSLSNPNRADRCATYCVLSCDSDSHRVDHRIVDYDHRAELRALDRVQHPASAYIQGFHQ